jgi:hypothetical protein
MRRRRVLGKSSFSEWAESAGGGEMRTGKMRRRKERKKGRWETPRWTWQSFYRNEQASSVERNTEGGKRGNEKDEEGEFDCLAESWNAGQSRAAEEAARKTSPSVRVRGERRGKVAFLFLERWGKRVGSLSPTSDLERVEKGSKGLRYRLAQAADPPERDDGGNALVELSEGGKAALALFLLTA